MPAHLPGRDRGTSRSGSRIVTGDTLDAVGAEDEPVSSRETPAVQRALEFGVDITLLLENLKYSPTERVRRAEQALKSVLALAAEAVAWRGGPARS